MRVKRGVPPPLIHSFPKCSLCIANWILDTVPHVKPYKKKGVIYQLSYWQYMVSHGFTRGHFWAKPPAKGDDDEIFHIHTKEQHILNQPKIDTRNFCKSALKMESLITFVSSKKKQEI
uniref:Histone acetyltransferase n=1 Tax=Caenorhabditis tropicalis TaxID=1561998 RepID=A0A1I7TVI9_9PELO